MAKDRYGFGTEEFDTKLNTAFKVAIRRELNPPKDQGMDRHLDNLKVILEYSQKYHLCSCVIDSDYSLI